ncbi:hypothetical protein BDY24DRAFT_168362 [Mrakia frigida]|uniref:uncharacterized protein n=1 Tax=Mrakia frigida TaxID=29902 RepID=UPI003FCC0291
MILLPHLLSLSLLAVMIKQFAVTTSPSSRFLRTGPSKTQLRVFPSISLYHRSCIRAAASVNTFLGYIETHIHASLRSISSRLRVFI